MPTKHHESGPSSLAKQELCPCFTSTDNVEQSESNYLDPAEEGTVLHLIMETGVVPEGFVFTDIHKTLIENTTRLKEEIIVGAEEVLNEVQYNIGKMPDGAYLTFGTCDVTALYPKQKRIKGIDYKFGFLPVDPVDVNAQVQAYSLGMLEEYPWAKEVEFHLILPRQTDHHLVGVFRREHMEQIQFRIDNIIHQRREGVRRVFMDACKFCDFRHDCPNLLSRLHPLVKLYKSSSDDLKVQNAIANFDPEQLAEHSPEQIGGFIRVLDFLHKVRERAREWARDFALHGTEIPGYSLGSRAPRQRQPYSSVRRVAEIACKEFGVDPLDLLDAMPTVSKSVMEGAVKATAEKGKGAATVRAFNQRLDVEKLWHDPSENPENIIYFLKTRPDPKPVTRKPPRIRKNHFPERPPAPVLVTKKKVTKK